MFSVQDLWWPCCFFCAAAPLVVCSQALAERKDPETGCVGPDTCGGLISVLHPSTGQSLTEPLAILDWKWTKQREFSLYGAQAPTLFCLRTFVPRGLNRGCPAWKKPGLSQFPQHASANRAESCWSGKDVCVRAVVRMRGHWMSSTCTSAFSPLYRHQHQGHPLVVIQTPLR